MSCCSRIVMEVSLLCNCDIFQCLKLKFKSALALEFLFTKLFESQMPMEVLSTFLTKSSLFSPLTLNH
jgi:hypothetical protein